MIKLARVRETKITHLYRYLVGGVGVCPCVFAWACCTQTACVTCRLDSTFMCVRRERRVYSTSTKKLPGISSRCTADTVTQSFTPSVLKSLRCIKAHFWRRPMILTAPERGEGSDTTISYSSRRKVKMSACDTRARFKNQIFGRLQSDNIGNFQKPTIRLVNTLQAATGVEVMK